MAFGAGGRNGWIAYPEIRADKNAEFNAIEFENTRLSARVKIISLVEKGGFIENSFVIGVNDLALMDHRCRLLKLAFLEIGMPHG